MKRIIGILAGFALFTCNLNATVFHYVRDWDWVNYDSNWKKFSRDPAQYDPFYAWRGMWASIGSIGGVDMRLEGAMAAHGGHKGQASIFTSDHPINDPKALFLGTDIYAKLDPKVKTEMERRLGYEHLNSQNLADCMWEMLTIKADPMGLKHPRPLMPTDDGMMELWLTGDGLVKSKQIIPFRSPEWPMVCRMHQIDYEWKRHDVLAGILPPNYHREFLALWSERWGVDYRNFIRPGLPDEKPIAYGTTQSDNFQCANNAADPSCQLTWIRINPDPSMFGILTSSAYNVNGAGEFIFYRASANVASANHTTQMDITQSITGGGSYKNCAALSRMDSSSAIGTDSSNAYGYSVGAGQQGDGLDYIIFAKVVAGNLTDLDSDKQLTIAPFPGTIKNIVNGSNMQSVWKSVTEHNFTDTTFSTATMGGAHARSNSGVGSEAFTNWSIADAGGGSVGANPRHFIPQNYIIGN